MHVQWKIWSVAIGLALMTWMGCSSKTDSSTTDPNQSAQAENEGATSQEESSQTFPALIQLPTGFQPEGIAIGRGTNFYVGSLVGGAIVRGDLRTGQSDTLVPQQTGKVAVGLSVDPQSNRLFVAGGATGIGYVYNVDTGNQEMAYTFTTEANPFINDVVVTRNAAYFTNSSQPVLYGVPLGPSGALPEEADVVTIPLGGEFQSAQGFNTNGIDATTDGKRLVIVNSTTGLLYTVDPASGNATEIDLEGEVMTAGDGILLDGKTLYVVRNQLNEIAVIRLSADLSSGKITGTITSPDFQVPTTIAEHGNNLYAVNAKFGVNNPGEIPYEVVKVIKK